MATKKDKRPNPAPKKGTNKSTRKAVVKKKPVAKKAAPKKRKTSPEQAEQKRRMDWEINHARIKETFITLIKEHKRTPTLTEMAKATRLGRKTIERHVKDIKFDAMLHPLRVLTEEVILSIFVSAKQGNSGSQKLWLQLFESFTDKTEKTVIHEFDASSLTTDELKQLLVLMNKAGVRFTSTQGIVSLPSSSHTDARWWPPTIIFLRSLWALTMIGSTIPNRVRLSLRCLRWSFVSFRGLYSANINSAIGFSMMVSCFFAINALL